MCQILFQGLRAQDESPGSIELALSAELREDFGRGQLGTVYQADTGAFVVFTFA